MHLSISSWYSEAFVGLNVKVKSQVTSLSEANLVTSTASLCFASICVCIASLCTDHTYGTKLRTNDPLRLQAAFFTVDLTQLQQSKSGHCGQPRSNSVF